LPLIKKVESYFISAGEHSGDLLGADLVLALKERMPKLNAFGIVGTAMANAGVDEIANISELSVMGVTEVLAKLPKLRMLETRILSWIDQCEPKFAVLIDNPGFHLRLAEQLRMRGIRVFQYVAPKIWAWGEGRAPALRENFDTILGILPFEEEFFQQRGISYAYVGSPLKDRIDKVIVTREALGLPKDKPVIACLPGSRPSELKLNLPTIAGVRDHLARKLPDAVFIVPVAHNLSFDAVTEALSYGGRAPMLERIEHGNVAVESYRCGNLIFVRGMSLELMAAADVAIVASGTATLECALLGTPMVVVYTMSELSYQIAIRKVKIPYVSLVNLIAGKKLVEEFIQDFSLEEISDELLSLLQDKDKRKYVRDSFEDIRDRLKGAAADNAATVIAGRCQ
jgi:lipid-A-disaccharide synthase